MDKVKRFAHRGLVQAAPENTLPAFEAAVAMGCEGIELDIRLSKDGEVMVIHDGDLARMTNCACTEDTANLTAKELSSLSIPYAGHLLPFDPPVPYSENRGSTAHYKAEEIARMRAEDTRTTRIITFKEFDEWFTGVKEDVTIEIEFCSDGLAAPMYDILSRSKNCGRYICFSGHNNINADLQNIMKKNGKPDGLRLGANVRRITNDNIYFIKTADLYEVGLNDKWFTADDVKFLSDSGIKVFSNLGDYPEWWTAIQTLGIEGFKTNYAEAYTKWLAEK